ncbi:hypothetical protein RAS1_10870 [Phycisphaerae bacterium RAS1]|nr:hypothetical protein RAS1_10870 [Phycisphaerae bacterium RAS1]
MIFERRCSRPLRVAPRGRRTPLAPVLESTTPAPGASDKQSWFRIRVVDNETGEPIPGIELKITQPNGQTVDCTTRPDGVAQVDFIDHGTCEVLCDLTAARLEETYAFIGFGREPLAYVEGDQAADEAPKPLTPNPDLTRSVTHGPRKGRFIANIEAYKVQTGDTLKSLAEGVGLTWQQLAIFNWGTAVPDEINLRLCDEVGCTHKRDGVNYSFDASDDPGIVYLPTQTWASGSAIETDTEHVVRVSLHRPLAWFDIETVDEFGVAVPGTSLVLKRRGGGEVRLTTNETGYFRQIDIPAGTYDVFLEDGSRAKYSRKTADELRKERSGQPEGELVDAVLDTRFARHSITSVVVRMGSATAREARRQIHQLYVRDAIRLDVAADAPPPPMEDKKPVRIVPTYFAIDNLALAATDWDDGGFSVQRLLKHLNDWLALHHPTTRSENRGFYLTLIDRGGAGGGRRLRIFSSAGQQKFEAALNTDFASPIGAYTTLQTQFGVVYADALRRAGFLERDKAVQADEVARMADMMDADAGAEYRRVKASLGRKANILYLTTSPEQLRFVARKGGSGLLEHYTGNAADDALIHARNMSVCEAAGGAWRAYIKHYIERVEATETEKELWKLGPPEKLYDFPTPANATQAQRDDYTDWRIRTKRWYNLEPWERISEKRAEFAGREPAGAKFSATFSPAVGAGGATISTNIHPTSDGFELGDSYEISVEIPDQIGRHKLPVGGGFSREVDAQTGETTDTVEIDFGRFGLSASSDGTFGYSAGPLGFEVNPEKREFKIGASIPTPWGDIELAFSVKGNTTDEVWVAMSANIPGFFDMRLPEDLLSETQWNDLDWREQTSLEKLGWTMDAWDRRLTSLDEYPQSTRTNPKNLSAEQMEAILMLGFRFDSWEASWKKLAARKPKK